MNGLSKASLHAIVRQPTPAAKTPSPLLLLLHGYGSNEDDLFGLAAMLPQQFTIISVRAPRALADGAYAWFELGFTSDGGITYDPAQVVDAQQKFTQFIAEVSATHPIDPKQIYLLGFSQGAMMSAMLALTQPQLVHGAVVLSGLIPPETHAALAEPAQRQHLTLFIGHGTFDEVVPVDQGRAAHDVLTNLNITHVYHEYPMGHQINEQCLDDVIDWLNEL